MALKKAGTPGKGVAHVPKGSKCLYCEGTGKVYTGFQVPVAAPADSVVGWKTQKCVHCGGLGVRNGV